MDHNRGFSRPSTSRDWVEDATNYPENGQYQCICAICRASFVGHKDRVECKLCASPTSPHMWLKGNLLIPHEHCGNCLAIRRRDGQNSAHCRGPIRLRSVDIPTAGC